MFNNLLLQLFNCLYFPSLNYFAKQFDLDLLLTHDIQYLIQQWYHFQYLAIILKASINT